MKKLLIIAAVVALSCTACGGGSPVNRSIKQVEDALERVEKNKADMTKADWEALNAELEEPLTIINEALDSDQIGVVGKVKVVMLVGKITAVMAEAGIDAIEAETGIDREDFGKELEKFGKELEEASEEMEKATEEAAE
jgi:ElaB/YqjD/DUF883 family membrane-anchored ribosome-binding protein